MYRTKKQKCWLALVISIYREKNNANTIIYQVSSKRKRKQCKSQNARQQAKLGPPPTWHIFLSTSRALPDRGFLLRRNTAGWAMRNIVPSLNEYNCRERTESCLLYLITPFYHKPNILMEKSPHSLNMFHYNTASLACMSHTHFSD